MHTEDQENPSEEQMSAVLEFAKKHGRVWKTELLNRWLNGRDANEPNGHLLRQVRNQFGPQWLESFKLPRSGPKPG